MSSVPTDIKLNQSSLVVPKWAQAKSFDEFIPVDVNRDGEDDYLVRVKTNPCAKTKLDASAYQNVEISNISTSKLISKDEKEKIYVRWNQGAHDLSVNVYYDADGKGGQMPYVAETAVLAQNKQTPAPFNTARRYLSFEPKESAPNGTHPTCVPCFPGLDVQGQGKFQALSPNSNAYDEINDLMQTLVKENGGKPLQELVLDNHGEENIITFEDKDGKKHRLYASEVLEIIAPYMAKDGVILFASCKVAKGDSFERAAKQLTSPTYGNGRYAGPKIFVSETVFGSPVDAYSHENKFTTHNVDSNGRRTATSGLVCIAGGEVANIPYEYKKTYLSGDTVGRYTDRTLFAPIETLFPQGR